MTRKPFISTLTLCWALASSQLGQAEVSTQVTAQDFLGADWMQSTVHQVNPVAINDGLFNNYTIETSDGTYTVRGTDQARQLIREIHATYQLRERSVGETVGKSLFNRTTNWVTTPVRTVEMVGDRIDAVSSVGDAILFVPKAVYDTGDVVVSSVGEFAVTGKRLVTGAAGTKCSGVGQCISEAGEDIWSGVNSLLGKHKAARRLHEEFGTDRQSKNPLLQREIDRLSYTEAYTGSAFKFAVPNANIDVLSDYQTGIGYYNNAEFVAGYTDAHRPRNSQREMLSDAGVSDELIEDLYKHEIYTHNQRTALTDALSVIQTKGDLNPFIVQANRAQSPEEAHNIIEIYRYIAHQIQQGQIARFVPGQIFTAQRPDGSLFAPLRADYLQWTNGLGAIAQPLASSGRSRAQIHLLGHAAPDVESRLSAMGIDLVQVSLN